MAYDKETFLKKVIVFHDTREQENGHILAAFEKLGVSHEKRKLDYGDYSFSVDGRDFSLSCCIERKANVNELYGNITHDRDRIEKMFYAASSMGTDFTLLIENCKDMEELKSYRISDWEKERFHRKIQNIGRPCASTIEAWQAGNRYQFKVIFVKDTCHTAVEILQRFYWFWHNYKKLTASRRNQICLKMDL